MRYADDTALVATDKNDLQNIVNQVKEESSKAGLEMNVKKTKTMVISKNPEEKNLEIKVDTQTLEQVDKFKYLGTQITDDGKPDTEIINRMSIAKNKFSSMAKLLTSRQLNINTKLNILKCYVFSKAVSHHVHCGSCVNGSLCLNRPRLTSSAILVTTCYVFHLEGAGKQCLGDGFQAFVNVN